MTDKECKGCTISSQCTVQQYSKGTNLICPCSICLVKVICNNDCADFIRFRSAALDKKLEAIKGKNKTESR